jgi:uncharacterized protein
MTIEEKENSLLEFIGMYKSALVAYSGGLDSALVLWASVKSLGPDKIWAVTSNSESYASGECEEARRIAGEIGFPDSHHIIIKTGEMENPDYVNNPVNRCFHCKSELFSRLTEIAKDKGIDVIFDGSNASDQEDFRPGRQAALENRVVSPLLEASLDKDEIRQIAARNNLSFSDKPAAACLASRFPYGTAITIEGLSQVDKAEEAIKKLGFKGFRVRFHGSVARLELAPEDIPKIFQNGLKDQIVREIKNAGFKYVALDLEGYRTGSLNEVLSGEGKNDDG